jgi:hypothetical protein
VHVIIDLCGVNLGVCWVKALFPAFHTHLIIDYYASFNCANRTLNVKGKQTELRWLQTTAQKTNCYAIVD